MITFQPSAAVWEITMGCNMRCKHCGSSCKSSLPDELTTDEALDLCNQLASLGIKAVTLSGGEPLLRNDWEQIATRLSELDIQPLIISNGWLVDEVVVKKICKSGIASFGISLDGLRDTHDFMRCEGSFDGIMKALQMLADNSIHTSVVTTINKRNLSELHEIKNILIQHDVKSWQLQFATPMGSFHAHKDELMIESHQVSDIINFAHEVKDEINVYLGDCIGYYSNVEHEVRKKNSSDEGAVWRGCPAGKHSLGILHNGDIVGCNSIRSQEFIEGNIREKRLQDIWESGFTWNRQFSRSKLTGFCLDCQYATYCLGGCPNVRLCLNGSIESDNSYCLYNSEIRAEFGRIDLEGVSFDDMVGLLGDASEGQNHNLEIMMIEKYLHKNIDLPKTQMSYLMNCLHFAYFQVERYEKAKEVCDAILNYNGNNSYALHGLAICLFYLGKRAEGFDILERLAKVDKSMLEETVRDICSATQLTHSVEDLRALETLIEH